MIRIEQSSIVPPVVLENLSEYSRKEFSRTTSHLELVERASSIICTAYDDNIPLVCFGLTKPTIIGPWTIWLLVCKDYKLEYARVTKSVFGTFVAGLGSVQTQIEETFFAGKRFAEFLGLKPTAMLFDVLGVQHRTYEGIF